MLIIDLILYVYSFYIALYSTVEEVHGLSSTELF